MINRGQPQTARSTSLSLAPNRFAECKYVLGTMVHFLRLQYRLLSSLLVSHHAVLNTAFSFTTTKPITTMATINRGGIAMVISPAKTLDLKKLSERSDEMELDYDAIATLSAAASAHAESLLCDQDKTCTIVNIMKKKSEAELKTLLSLSPSLAKTAHENWSNFSLESSDDDNIKEKNDHFAIFTFNGPAYQGISAHTCNKSTLSYMSKNLFILDPVYGVLRSLDTMQPYRLEMGVKGIVSNDNSKQGKKDTLVSYWKDSVTSYLGKEMNNNNKSSSAPSILANLASDEYSSSIEISSLPPNTIYLNIIFRHQGRVLSVHAKKARGLMARYLSETNAQTLEDIANFNLENYNCVPINDKDDKWEVVDVVGDNDVQIMKMIFDRSEAPPKNKATAGKRSNTPAASTKQGGKKTKKKK